MLLRDFRMLKMFLSAAGVSCFSHTALYLCVEGFKKDKEKVQTSRNRDLNAVALGAGLLGSGMALGEYMM